jgi:hypothetical protein
MVWPVVVMALSDTGDAREFLAQRVAEMSARQNMSYTIARHEGEPGAGMDFEGQLEIHFASPAKFRADYNSTWGDGFRVVVSGGKMLEDDLSQGGPGPAAKAIDSPLSESRFMRSSLFARALSGRLESLVSPQAQVGMRATSALRRRVNVTDGEEVKTLDFARTTGGWVLEMASETVTRRFGEFVFVSGVEERLLQAVPLRAKARAFRIG